MSEALAPIHTPLVRRAPAKPRPAPDGDSAGPRPSNLADAGTSIRLRPNVAAPSLARNRAGWICARHDLPEHVVRDVAFIAGELVAISVRQVRAPLELDLGVDLNCVTVRVRELGVGGYAHDRPSGVSTNRSLHLVQCVAQSWGVLDTERGREMWASVVRPARSD